MTTSEELELDGLVQMYIGSAHREHAPGHLIFQERCVLCTVNVNDEAASDPCPWLAEYVARHTPAVAPETGPLVDVKYVAEMRFTDITHDRWTTVSPWCDSPEEVEQHLDTLRSTWAKPKPIEFRILTLVRSITN